MNAKLTKRVVDAIEPDPKGDVFVWDTELRGFGIRMKPSGSASWIIQYRNANGRTRRIALGKIGVLTPAQARKEARERLGDVAKGGDPSAERKSARRAITVSELCDQYLKDAEAEDRIKASTLAMDKSRIETHVKPLIGNRVARTLTHADIVKFQRDVANGRTAKPRPAKGRGGRTTGGKGVAARTVGMLGTIFEYARRRGLVDDNPIRGVRRYPDNASTFSLSEPQIEALGVAMMSGFKSGENSTAISAAALQGMTGFRVSEALGLEWAWIDLDAQCVRFPDTKTGAQIRPIGAAVVRFLRDLPREEEQVFVFPADRGDGHFVGLPRVLERLRLAAGLPPEIKTHTFRHTFASVAAGLGFSELTIAGLLGQKSKGVTARYAHVPDRALLAAADQVSARIASLLGQKPVADIVRLPGVAQPVQASSKAS